MRPEARRLHRLQRLEKVRAIARQSAARASAEAESTLAQLEALSLRTGSLVADYAARGDAADGGELRHLATFRAGLGQVSAATRADTERARGHADLRQQALAEAERLRQAAEDRARAEALALARQSAAPPLGARRQLGTGLE